MSSQKGKFLLWCTRLAVKDEFKLSGHIIKDVVYNREGQLTWFSPRLFLLQWLWPTLLNLKPKSLHLISEFHPNLSGVKTKLSNDFAVLEFGKLWNWSYSKVLWVVKSPLNKIITVFIDFVSLWIALNTLSFSDFTVSILILSTLLTHSSSDLKFTCCFRLKPTQPSSKFFAAVQGQLSLSCDNKSKLNLLETTQSYYCIRRDPLLKVAS